MQHGSRRGTRSITVQGEGEAEGAGPDLATPVPAAKAAAALMAALALPASPGVSTCTLSSGDSLGLALKRVAS